MRVCRCCFLSSPLCPAARLLGSFFPPPPPPATPPPPPPRYSPPPPHPPTPPTTSPSCKMREYLIFPQSLYFQRAFFSGHFSLSSFPLRFPPFIPGALATTAPLDTRNYIRPANSYPSTAREERHCRACTGPPLQNRVHHGLLRLAPLPQLLAS